MHTIPVYQGDTKPDLIITIYDRANSIYVSSGLGMQVTLNNAFSDPTVGPTVTGAVDLSDPKVSVLCKFRETGGDSNVFSVYCQKIGTGSTGNVLLKWPFFGLDVDEGDYEIEVTVFWGARSQKVTEVIPVYVTEQFPQDSLIADDEDAKFINGKLYLRNLDTGDVHALAIIGTTSQTLELDSGEVTPDFTTSITEVLLRVVSGNLYIYNTEDSYWHQLNLRDNSGVPYFEILDATLQLDASTVGSDVISTVAGKFYMKNLDTNKWHRVSIRGASGSQTFEIGDGETL